MILLNIHLDVVVTSTGSFVGILISNLSHISVTILFTKSISKSSVYVEWPRPLNSSCLSLSKGELYSYMIHYSTEKGMNYPLIRFNLVPLPRVEGLSKIANGLPPNYAGRWAIHSRLVNFRLG